MLHPNRPRKYPIRARLSAGAALSIAVILGASVATPAYAASAPADALGAPTIVHAAAGPLQSLPASAAEPVTIQRDAYTVAVPAPAPPVNSRPAVSTDSPSALVRWPFPTTVRISDGFGPRLVPCAGCATFHDGLDLLGGNGTAIGAIAAGVVSEASPADIGGLGVHVAIDHTVNGRRIRSVYGHMQVGSLTVGVGQSVVAGQALGRVGTTGQSTGPHLHLGIFLDDVTATDPLAWLTANAGPQ